MARKIKDLPKHFHGNKVEISRSIRTYWANKLDDKGQRLVTSENLALLYIQLEELQAYVEQEFCNLGTELLTQFTKEGKDMVLLPEYGQVLEYDDEAKWIFRRTPTEAEYRDYDEKCSREYAESKKK